VIHSKIMFPSSSASRLGPTKPHGANLNTPAGNRVSLCPKGDTSARHCVRR
jgi:hypothetical protein